MYLLISICIYNKVYNNNMRITEILMICLGVRASIGFVVDIHQCTNDTKPNIYPFTYTTNGTVDNTTTAHMCYDKQFLHIRWFSIDE